MHRLPDKQKLFWICNCDDVDIYYHLLFTYMYSVHVICPLDLQVWCPRADPGFQVRGAALTKSVPSGGRREHFWGISCEKSRFYAKNHIFSNFRQGAPPWIRPWCLLPVNHETLPIYVLFYVIYSPLGVL